MISGDDDVEALKAQNAHLSRIDVDQVPQKIEPAVIDGQPAIKIPDQGALAGVPVRGIIDLINTSGRLLDSKSASRTPSKLSVPPSILVATNG